MFLIPMQPLARMLLLKMACRARLERRQINRVGFDKLLGGGADICDETIEQIKGHGFADDDAQDFGFVTRGREGIVFVSKGRRLV